MNYNFRGWKPMLLNNKEVNLSTVNFKVMEYTDKLDGVRIALTNKGVYGRSLKPINNVNIQKKFEGFCKTLSNNIIVEAELWSPVLPCREISGIATSDDKEVINSLNAHCFDIYDYDNRMVFGDRLKQLRKCVNSYNDESVVVIKSTPLANEEHLMRLYKNCLSQGGEGGVIKDVTKRYKCGRVTINEHIAYKLKEFEEVDLKIIGVTERFLNTNESQKNELGRSFKRNTVADKQPTGIAATFIVALKGYKGPIPLWEYDVKDKTIGKVTITGDEDSRREIWNNKESYCGQFAVIKSMSTGVKDKLRHPTLLNIKREVEK